MSAHTKGLWRVGDENAGGGANIIDERGIMIAATFEHNAARVTRGIGIDSAEAAANARLIAAAPDLLAACKALVAWEQMYPVSRIYDEVTVRRIAAEMSEIVAAARAAIKQATGDES